MRRTITQAGQVFLALVLFIGGIVIAVGLLMAFLAASSADTGYGASASLIAESAATTGAEDALLKLDRNAAFFSTGYTVSSGSSTATVVVTNPSSVADQAIILSTAVVALHTKKIQVIVSENPSTAQVNIISWTEIQ